MPTKIARSKTKKVTSKKEEATKLFFARMQVFDVKLNGKTFRPKSK